MITCLNNFPNKQGISRTLSPSAIILGKPKTNYNTLTISSGAYAEVFESTDNTMKSRSVGAIALRPSNGRGGYYFQSLKTGKRIHSNQWKELPIPDHVVDRVEEMADDEGQPLMKNGMPIFEWSPGVPILDDTDPQLTNTPGHDESHDEYIDFAAPDTTDDDASINSSTTTSDELSSSDDESDSDEDEPLVDNDNDPEIPVDDNVITDDNTTPSDEDDDEDVEDDNESNTSSTDQITDVEPTDETDLENTPVTPPPSNTHDITELRSLWMDSSARIGYVTTLLV